MQCFYYFKDKSRVAREQKSAPAIPNQSRSKGSPSPTAKKTSKSSGSAVSTGSSQSHRSIPALFKEKAQNLQVFTFNELRNITDNFNRLNKIGEGGFGSVYKGYIRPRNRRGDRIPVAVKKLNQNGLQVWPVQHLQDDTPTIEMICTDGSRIYDVQIIPTYSRIIIGVVSRQGHKQWMAEVQFLAVVEHPNLVKLIGYCAVDGERAIQRLLIYELMPNKSLEDHLFNRAYPTLPWNTRLNIALGVAQGIAYLHEGLEVQVIYRDFKASNVLLDNDFNPKLSDFGLAREGPADGHTHVSTAVVGTYGYAAPDYIETGHLTIKSDVWSFGVVLYEILTGRRSLETNRPRGEQKLLEWVRQFPPDSRRFSMIMDPRLGNQYSMEAARRIAKLADSCLIKQSKNRPSMSEVVEALKQAIQTSETGGTTGPTTDMIEEVSSSTDLDGERNSDDARASEYSRRRRAHLEKLRENADATGRRRFMLMQRAKVQ
ncbi:putative receptor-like protein kinase [Acorus gramineus]|uniref:Receptor-like protein kinase n=1 Tax=Acorus gramineus TaxID=55184 RepID=A0AAV9BAE2_ACOGR|nr:putative receptor-like protein kinase [Acorus gramineus]